MKLSVAARNAIDKCYRHFLNLSESTQTRGIDDIVGYLHYCATKKSVIDELKGLGEAYLLKHALPTPEVLAEFKQDPKAAITPQARAIRDSSLRKKEPPRVSVANKPAVESKPKKGPMPSEGKMNMLVRLKKEDERKLRLLAAQDCMSPQSYIRGLLEVHLAKFDFGD